MKTIELQNNIIHKVLEIKNEQFLNYVYSILISENMKTYQMNDFEKSIIEESLTEYKKGKTISNKDVFTRLKMK